MKYLLILAALLVLAGCKFDAPLTQKPTRDIDQALLGSWFSLSDGSALDIYRLSSDEYLVIDERTPYICTHSDLSGTSFISGKQLQNDREYYGKYVYVAYKLEKGILTLSNLSDSLKIKENSSPAQIRLVIEEAVKNGSALDATPGHERQFKKKL